jgi:hypothetical protein
MFITRALNDLRMVKADLQRSQDDYGGHKDSAIAACDKAMEELDAVIKAMPPMPAPQRIPQQPQPEATPPSGAQQPVPPPAGAPPSQPQH